MTLKQSIKSFWKNYFNFKGKASQSEYWWNIGVMFVAQSILLLLVNYSLFLITLVLIYDIVMILPFMSLASRRCHDIKISGMASILLLEPAIISSMAPVTSQVLNIIFILTLGLIKSR